MPLYEYQCKACGKISEILMIRAEDIPKCQFCSSTHMDKQMSAHSTANTFGHSLPGPGDTTCCGSAPGQAAGCAGPGSCLWEEWLNMSNLDDFLDQLQADIFEEARTALGDKGHLNGGGTQSLTSHKRPGWLWPGHGRVRRHHGNIFKGQGQPCGECFISYHWLCVQCCLWILCRRMDVGQNNGRTCRYGGPGGA